MLGSQYHFRDKVKVGILGATGSVGQRFVEILARHPWFEITALAASDRSTGKFYKDAVNWILPESLPEDIGNMVLQPCLPNLPCSVAFSGLDTSIARDIESQFAAAGYMVVSNTSSHRMDKDVPLVVPEVNGSHLEMIHLQSTKGKIVTNPNCSVIGLTVALKPLADLFGIESVQVVTLQAISGAGYPGVASLDILDNAIPYISGEEEKLSCEPAKILGEYANGKLVFSPLKISASCNRVPVNDGHLECVSVKLKTKASKQDIIHAWQQFTSEVSELKLPTAPSKPIYYFEQENYPQPKIHRHLDKGMAISIGRLRDCPVLDYKFVLLSHNTIRGAAGGAILSAEMMMRKGYIFW